LPPSLTGSKLPSKGSPKIETDLERFDEEYGGRDIDARRHPEEQMVPKFEYPNEDPTARQQSE
jgi:hypothetical protein